MKLAESPVSAAFDLTQEKDATRRGYGNSHPLDKVVLFGQAN